ncbi:hypothetical protein ES703_59363 [subsurface metagenome]
MPKTKTLDFPVESFTFSLDKLHFVLDGLEDIITYFTKHFGKTAQFKLTLDLQYIPRKPRPKDPKTQRPNRPR